MKNGRPQNSDSAIPGICEECHEQKATVFRKLINDGKMTNQSLCEQCASPLLQLQDEDGEAPTAFPDVKELPPVPPDPNRPATISIPDPVTVQALAEKLCVKPWQLIPELIIRKVFITQDHRIDFAIASAVCARYGVVAQKLEEPE